MINDRASLTGPLWLNTVSTQRVEDTRGLPRSAAYVYELCFLTERVDDLPNGMTSHTEPLENCFVFGKELIRYEPNEDSMLKPIMKK
jgi:hypothetical protein